MALKRVAELDPNGVYLGMKEVDEADLTARHLPQVGECDLPPMMYQWNGRTFVPLPSVFYTLLRALVVQGTLLPAAAIAWMRAHEQSLNRKGR